MNNILNIYNIELKRIYKLYLVLLGLLAVGNIGLFLITISKVINQVAYETKSKASLGLIKLDEAKISLYKNGLQNIKEITALLLGLVVILCLIYGIVIWYRDFIGRNKTGYTLFMLPYNKFNIYIAKAITIIVMIYTVMITQMLFWVIDIGVIKILFNLNSEEMIYILDIFITGGPGLPLIQFYFTDFIMINVLGVILAVVVIFTGVMIQKSFKIVGMILGCMYILVSMFLFVYVTSFSRFSDQYLMSHSIYYIVLFSTSVGLSYILLNKKVYI